MPSSTNNTKNTLNINIIVGAKKTGKESVLDDSPSVSSCSSSEHVCPNSTITKVNENKEDDTSLEKEDKKRITAIRTRFY